MLLANKETICDMAPEALVNVRPKNSGFKASKMTKSLSVDRGFQTIKVEPLSKDSGFEASWG
jgi:hypothetical protein